MLDGLPFELLGEIAPHLSQAQHFRNLSLTCHRLHRFVDKDGWRIFVQNCFPSIRPPPVWKDAARGLTTISRNWDRRALIARCVQPSGLILKLPGKVWQTQWSKPTGQTMGFKPLIDSYEWMGTSWKDRTEVLTYSAGAELILRVKQSGFDAQQKWETLSKKSRQFAFDRFRNSVRWFTYRPHDAREGIDDILCVKLLQEGSRSSSSQGFSPSVVIGTASGRLEALRIPVVDLTEPLSLSSQIFQTPPGTAVNSIDIASSTNQWLAASFPGNSVALYSIPGDVDNESERHEAISPLSKVNIKSEDDEPEQRTWITRFISSDKLAVGSGPSETPLRIYQVGESGIVETPIRKFSCRPMLRQQDGIEGYSRPPPTSVYQITPVSGSSANGDVAGNVFLCGLYNGLITAHDLRSPRDYVQTYSDPIDQSAIYSLQAIGRERMAAGGARHNTIKFFDLRMSGGRAYYCEQSIRLPKKKQSQRQCNSCSQARSKQPPSFGWNLFLAPCDPLHTIRRPRSDWCGTGRVRRYGQTTRRNIYSMPHDSPIYSLSSPSPCSTSLFAGIEDNVVQVDLVSMRDKNPDPMFEHGIVRFPGHQDIHTAKTWDPYGDVLDLAMYEHNEDGGIGLMNQTTASGALKSEEWIEGYDERWTRSERWKQAEAWKSWKCTACD